MSILARPALLARTTALLRQNPVVALLGPRQSGKTTLAGQIMTVQKGQRFDLDDPRDVQRMAEPMTALEGLRGLVVIDEIQRQPNLFPVLRVLADRRPVRARFLVLGSASPELLRQGSETLAGRIRFIELSGFSLGEVGPAQLRRLWTRGGFPRSYLARSEVDSFGWREDFIQTFLERDINQLGVGVRSSVQLRRLWSMLAHRHGQLWNGAELASALGEAYPTVKRHLDVLTGALMVRQLPPWLPNMEKRLVKAPKVFLRDSGLLHGLLGVRTTSELEGHPKLGASWEGFVLEEVIRRTGDRDVYFWATHAGAELDILVQRGRGPVGIEVKWRDAPTMTKSIHIALTDLGLRRLFVVYPGPRRYTLQKNVEVIPAAELDTILD